MRTAAILPATSTAKLRRWLKIAGYKVCSLLEHPLVVVVDLSDPNGSREIKALRTNPQTSHLGVLAVIGDTRGDAQNALRANADSFVARGALKREFDLRLEAVRQLGAARVEHSRREQDLAVLLDLTAHYAAALDVATLLHDVTRRLAEELAIDRCALVLIDEEHGLGHIVAASDDRAVRDLRIELVRYPEIREAVRTGAPVVVDDVGSHPLLGEVKEMVARRGIAALAAVPLTVQQKTLGVLLLRASNRFKPHEINFAWTVAHATAIALRNARMLEGLRGQAEKYEAQVAELARYEEFFQYVSDGIAILDETGAILSLNPAGAEILGLAGEPGKGRRFADFAAPSSAAAMTEMLANVRLGLVCRDVDLEVRRLDQYFATLSVCGSGVRGGRGIILSFRDVTAQRGIQRELRKTKEFLEKLVNSSVDGIVAADLKGKVILFNRSAEQIFGYSSREVMGNIFIQQLYAEDGMAKRVMTLLRSKKHGGVGQLEPTRTVVRAKDGELVPVLMSAALIFEGNAPVASVAVFNDLRERTRLEAKLSQTQERLKEAEKHAVVVEFAGATAHELNQPLTAVMGYAEILKRKLQENDPVYKHVDIIFREAERMKEIVRKIGKIVRHETKHYVGETHIIDLDRATLEDEESSKS